MTVVPFPKAEPEIDQDFCQRVIERMHDWLAGEPVWSYERILAEWGHDFENYRRAWSRSDYRLDRDTNRTLTTFHLRDMWIERFGFAIPCAELLDICKSLGPIVEIGAGSGYMTRLMRNHGIDVLGSDSLDQGYTFKLGKYDPMQISAAGKTMARRHRDRAVFCSWPTYAHTWFRQTLRAMHVGQRLIVIREDATGDDSAWTYLDACFKEEQSVWIPCWNYMHDRCEVWIKKTNRHDHTALNDSAFEEARRHDEYRKQWTEKTPTG